MSAFVPPSGSAPAAGSSNTDPNQDASDADLGGLSMSQMQPSFSPSGQQAPTGHYNYTPTGTPGTYAVHEPGASAPAGRPQINTRHAVSPKGLSKIISHLRSQHGGGGSAGHHPSHHSSSKGGGGIHLPKMSGGPKLSGGFNK